MTQEELKKIKQELEKAQDDTTPYAVVSGENISIVGDANKTLPKNRDYKVKFRFPKQFEAFVDGKKDFVGEYFFVDIEYKDVTLKARNDLVIVQSITKMLPFFNKINEQAQSVEPLTDEEQAQIALELEPEILDSMYDVVKTMLGIDNTLADYITLQSVVDTLAKLINDFPEVFNEADAFFA